MTVARYLRRLRRDPDAAVKKGEAAATWCHPPEWDRPYRPRVRMPEYPRPLTGWIPIEFDLEGHECEKPRALDPKVAVCAQQFHSDIQRSLLRR
mgnify:CR=1 FL=1